MPAAISHGGNKNRDEVSNNYDGGGDVTKWLLGGAKRRYMGQFTCLGGKAIQGCPLVAVLTVNRLRGSSAGNRMPSSTLGLGLASGVDGRVNLVTNGAQNGLVCPSCP